jgi:hypothetical protein
VLGHAVVWHAGAVVVGGAGADVLLKQHRITIINLVP